MEFCAVPSPSSPKWFSFTVLALICVWDSLVFRLQSCLNHLPKCGLALVTCSLYSIERAKQSQAWWCTAVIPATQEAEAGGSLEPAWRNLANSEVNISTVWVPLLSHSPWGGEMRKLHLGAILPQILVPVESWETHRPEIDAPPNTWLGLLRSIKKACDN
jgi:hypothetical protein